MAKILDFKDVHRAAALKAFQALSSPSFDFEACPRGSISTLAAMSPCNGCPLFEVCSDECGMNDANGYY